ncbi:MAG: hydrogenase maturation nickel metallochaperone HypA [Bacteroidales bacterium]|nr:hydrogenase maturation nickel metallochaperone HypA [Bacteroidales bacterium]
MHELSIIQNIIEIAKKEAVARNSKRVEEIVIEVGELTGINTEFLKFSFDTTRDKAMFENCILTILPVQGQMQCLNCGNRFETNSFLCSCPLCNKNENVVIKGKELIIKSLLLE